MPTQGTRKAHSDAPGEDAVKETKRHLGWPEDKQFYIPDEALAHFREAIQRGEQFEGEWNELVSKYEPSHPEEAKSWRATMSGELPGHPLDQVDRREAAVGLGVVGGGHVDPQWADVRVAEGIVAQQVALDLELVEASHRLPRPRLHPALLSGCTGRRPRTLWSPQPRLTR